MEQRVINAPRFALCSMLLHVFSCGYNCRFQDNVPCRTVPGEAILYYAAEDRQEIIRYGEKKVQTPEKQRFIRVKVERDINKEKFHPEGREEIQNL